MQQFKTRTLSQKKKKKRFIYKRNIDMFDRSLRIAIVIKYCNSNNRVLSLSEKWNNVVGREQWGRRMSKQVVQNRYGPPS